ncbi:MAG: sulfurtransferase [Actinobacteria bacterium 13_2_20CM_2_71_6]|nr:MAG: sulfurtransferase [Actinobacteria bacterium 13_2_20CM_2_71_6]
MFGRPPIPAVRAREIGDDVYLVDVREDDEWQAGHAPGAVHLPMMELPGRLGEIPEQGDVLVVCRSGHRSAEVVGYLLGRGFGHVRNVSDGMLGWAAAGRPLVSEDGDVPTVI